MGWQSNDSSAPFSRQRGVEWCAGLGALCVSHLSLCSLGVNGSRTPPPWVTLRPFLFLPLLLHYVVLGYDF